ncbi:SNF1-interacting protein [Ophidiomyces ophidiicola]|uniref:SNF1-interacting protein n=1 Tax=Ophidiomyces ophidiicola TaxID=1387563 RepID=A0ACB8USR7_9EURO|nr:SNF1-interacting protein [Ophidiomyces ophidiicola]KAI1909848.1 SNF1-interacting protein [Ophidiomyces ophidiicola]KAI1924999.1 SNF1-interacting protein [Ophidiomyces ophidiicola]KAI1940949.1 SNF1-interacting protein [Ophidiomyces ophidiicola]KAI1950767.1 SNF1-interacting protein [Ophidiomyces ophidiicola]
MGNNPTKESRSYNGHAIRHSRGDSISTASYEHYRISESPHAAASSRTLRAGRPEFALLGPDRDQQLQEHRRETRQEREARKREKENAARVKERERSMKEEHVDGGYLVTQGVYVGSEDFNKAVVRQLMIERRLAPFWRGLNDFSDSWTEHQLMAAARGMPIPAPDEVPPELEYKIPSKSSEDRMPSEKNLNTLMVPISSRSQSYNSDTSSVNRTLSPPRSPGALSPTGSFFRSRAKTLASLTTSSKTNIADPASRETQLPKDPFINGQPIEAYLYKDASECPICFLYYPPYLNKTRCCDQPICSECFVQIKRPDPHPPEHPESNNSENNGPDVSDTQLVSEAAACPFCVQPEFGVTYLPPPFRRGLAYAPNSTMHPLADSSPTSSVSSLTSGGQPPTSRRRATSISADSPGVITTDKVRPDWATKLAAARAQAARRSAAATALHTAAYLMNTPGGPLEPRRRSMLRRATGQDSPNSRTGSPHLNALAYLAERRALSEREHGSPGDSSTNLAPPRASSRRSRIDELEEMMMMEAIRLSLAAEEERRKKEEKDAKKEAKKRDKEAKKAGKQARKSVLYSANASSVAMNTSSNNIQSGVADTANQEPDTSTCKGKGVDRSEPDASAIMASSCLEKDPKLSPKVSDSERLGVLAENSCKQTQLRHVSSASSSRSSLVESVFGESLGSSTPPNGPNANLGPIHGFRSLAAMIGDATSSDLLDTKSPDHENALEQTDAEPQEPRHCSKANELGQIALLSPSPVSEQKGTLGKEARSSASEIPPEPTPSTSSP